ncbi:uncharacterized protein [Panulirus ornatus]|uniref:uncharacterized protein n=1 Tax=Panulirus ornatus TaxID=150431 RepID=UPI003A89CFA1
MGDKFLMTPPLDIIFHITYNFFPVCVPNIRKLTDESTNTCWNRLEEEETEATLVVRTGILLFTVLCSTTATNVDETAAVKAVPNESSTAEVEDKGSNDDAYKVGGKFFLKNYSTATWTFLSSFTSTIPYTCFNTGAAAPPACMGRRLRRSKKLSLNLDAIDLDGTPISSSQDESFKDTGEDSDLGKRFFTLWRTSSTTFTITTFSTNRSVTVSASVACTFPGAIINIC